MHQVLEAGTRKCLAFWLEKLQINFLVDRLINSLTNRFSSTDNKWEHEELLPPQRSVVC